MNVGVPVGPQELPARLIMKQTHTYILHTDPTVLDQCV